MAAAVFFVAFAVYAATAAPAIGWLDSAEFVAAAATLGVPHSPGHPLQAILGHLATLVPLGDVAIRVNVLSATCMAGAMAMLYRSVCELGNQLAVDARRPTIELVALATTVCVTFSAAAWVQAGRAEVYALEMLLISAALHSALAFLGQGRPRHLLCFALVTGLALTTHHFMTLTFALPMTVLLLWAKRPGIGSLGAALVSGIAGLAAFAYLPVRAAAAPALNWGDPDSLSRLLWTISGRAFAGSLTEEHTSTFSADALQALGGIIESSPLLFVLAIIGVYLGLRQRRNAGLTLAAAAIMGLTIVGRAVLGFDPETPDHHAYLLPGIFAMAVLGGSALFNLAALLPANDRQLAGIAAAAAAALTLYGASSELGRTDQSAAFAADDVARLVIDAPPPGSVALTSYFQTSFRVLALRTAEGARPDVAFIDRSFLTYPGEREAARAKHPELAALIDSGLEPGNPAPIEALTAVSQTRPIVIELHFNLDRGYHPHLNAAGAFARFREIPSAGTGARFERSIRAAHDSASGSDREWAKMHLVWTYFVGLLHACETANIDAARTIYARAQDYAAGDVMLDELAERCRVRPGGSPTE